MVCCHVNAQNSSTFSEVIPIKSDRCQILHHAVVIGVSTVLYVEANTHEIQRCVLVSFSDELISEYKEVMNYIYDNYMHWIYRKNEVVPTFDTEILGNCTDMHTLHQTLSVWHAAVRCYEESGSVPFPAIRSISPAIVSYWNYTKGGCDVISRLIANANTPFHHNSVEASLWDRFIILSLVNVFRLIGIQKLTATNGNIRDLEQLSSTDALQRKFLNLGSFESFLGFAIDAFKSKAKSCQHERNMMASSDILDDDLIPQAENRDQGSSGVPETMSYRKKRLWFQSDAGLQYRTTFTDENNHLVGVGHRRLCIFCHASRSMYCCKTCGVALCIKPYASNDRETTCFEIFHSKICNFCDSSSSDSEGNHSDDDESSK
jgi:hypothetical protein